MGGYGGGEGLGGKAGRDVAVAATGMLGCVWGGGGVKGDGGEIKVILQPTPFIMNDVGIKLSVSLYNDAMIRPTRASEAAFARRVSHDSSAEPLKVPSENPDT